MISLKHNQKAKQIYRLLLYITVGIFLSGGFTPAGATDYTMAKYIKLPPFISREVKPNVIIALDISGSMKAVAYDDTTLAGNWRNKLHANFDPLKNYYGYFSSTDTYKYNAAKEFFEIDNAAPASQAWSGNFLNWMAMRRMDVVRKVLVGGKVTVKTKNQQVGHPTFGQIVAVNRNRAKQFPADWTTDWDGYYVLEGQHEPADRTFRKSYASSKTGGYTPNIYPDGQIFLMSEGQIIPQVTVVPLGPSVEIGYVTMDWDNDNPEWFYVPFQNDFTEPRVVVGGQTFNGSEDLGDPRFEFGLKDGTRTTPAAAAAAAKATHGDGGFWIRLQEWPYLANQDHTTETFAYLVVESDASAEGADGWISVTMDPPASNVWKFQAQETLATVGNGQCGYNNRNNLTVTYDDPSPATHNYKPLVFSAVGTYNGTDTIVTRHKDIAKDKVKVSIQEQKSSGGKTSCNHSNEDLHVILVLPPSDPDTTVSADTFGGIPIQAGIKKNVDKTWNTITYSAGFTETPVFLGDMQTFNEADPATVRVGGSNQTNDAGAIELKIREERSDGSGRAHGNENVGWLAVQAAVEGYRIRVGVTTEPTGIIQDIADTMRIGVAVYNYDHSLDPTSIYTGNKVHGGTFWPAYPDATLPADQQSNYDISLSTGVHDPIENIMQVIEEHPLIWGTTPIAETLVEISNYLQQADANGNGHFDDKSTNPVYPTDANSPRGGGNSQDPYWYDDVGQKMECAKTFILHFNDGAPYRDWDHADNNPPFVNGWPSVTYNDKFGDLQTTSLNADLDGDGNWGKNQQLDDLAYFLRNNDMRTDLTGYQEFVSYYVFAALGEELTPNDDMKRMRDSAINGGFEDFDNDHEPDPPQPSAGNTLQGYDDINDYITAGTVAPTSITCGATEWDEDADCEPDTFYFASDGYQLVSELTAAFQSILRRTSSGTAASVISNSRSGEGAIYQSIFYPVFNDNAARRVEWVGQVHSMLVDAFGNMREDTNGNGQLDLFDDYFITFQGETVVKYKDINGDGQLTSYDLNDPGQINVTGDIMSIKYLWSSSNWLNTLSDPNVIVQRAYASTDNKRYIFSFADADGDMVADAGETVAFESPALPSVADLSDQSKIYPYISVYPWLSTSGTAPTYIDPQRADCLAVPANCGPFQDFLQRQTQRVVNFIRGEDQGAYTSSGFGASDYTIPAFRSRQVDYNDDGTVDTWRMGDIVNSTPTLVAAPAEKYDLIYGDTSYGTFYNQYRNRRNVVYVGANDGMFHAFNAGFYNSSLKKFELQKNGETQYPLGSEIWAYVPYNLLPHLYWLTDVDYEHVYYVDLKPRIFDAKIFPADATHPGGWGTVLVGGMRFGGGEIGADLDKTDGSLAFDGTTDRKMSSAYFIMDITDPETPPVLLAEITLADLGYTTNYPTVFPIIDAATSTNKWYLVFGSGPAPTDPDDANNTLTTVKSNQPGKIYVLDLVELATNGNLTFTDQVAGASKAFAELDTNTFISDMAAVDFDLDYKTNAAYFGTVNYDAVNGWGGKLRRIVVDNDPDPGTWDATGADSLLIDLSPTAPNNGQPIVAAPAIGLEASSSGLFQRWVFFGTGRFYTRNDAYNSDQQTYYGIKEKYDIPTSTWTWDQISKANLLDVSNAKVYDGGTVVQGVAGVANYNELETAVDAKDGWFMDFADAKERNLGQAVLFGDILTFTTYVPDVNPCAFEGETFLYALDFTTGTAYSESVIGLDSTDTYDPGGGDPLLSKVLKRSSLGKGLSLTPNIHTGRETGTKAYVQTSTGAIEVIQQINPGLTKSDKISWEEED